MVISASQVSVDADIIRTLRITFYINLSNALSWLKEAATRGDSRGQLFLAEIYAKDERCYNKDEALYWFCQLALHDSIRNPELRGYAF